MTNTGANSALLETLHELLLNRGVDLCCNECFALLLGFASLHLLVDGDNLLLDLLCKLPHADEILIDAREAELGLVLHRLRPVQKMLVNLLQGLRALRDRASMGGSGKLWRSFG